MKLFKAIDFHFLSVTLFIAFFIGGCVPKSSHIHTTSLALQGEDRHDILLMPMDVQLSIVNAGGLLEPQAEWTENAEHNITTALENKLEEILKLNLISGKDFDRIHLNSEEKKKHEQLVKLHAAVGYSILVHQYMVRLSLPSKKGEFEWSLGPAARFLRDRYNADYALFVFMRDSYASGGRVALIAVSALFGAALPGGQQVGFASLVDLNTGQVVWFNRLARGVGDLRTEPAAQESIDLLLENFPL